eukprot:6174040-Pleurochrysis_carterae.AAC.2
MFICKYLPISQFGAILRRSPLAARRLALFPSCSPAPCAVPLLQPGALRCPPLAARRLELSRLALPGAVRHLSPPTCDSELRRALHATLFHHSCHHGRTLEKARRHRQCLCSACARFFAANFADWIIVEVEKRKCGPLVTVAERVETCTRIWISRSPRNGILPQHLWW